MAISNEQIKKVGEILQSKGAALPCSRCGHTHFSVVDYSMIQLQPMDGSFVVGGAAVPVVLVACNNCGNIWTHALAVLGLLPSDMKKGS